MAKVNIKNKPMGSDDKKSGKIQLDTNIFVTQEVHDKLVEHIVERMDAVKPIRESQNSKFEKIDKAIYCFLKLDEDDEKRARDNQKGYGVKPTEQILPLTLVQLDEALTFLMEVLATSDGLYSAMAPKEQQEIAKAFTSLMNEHARRFGHEVELAKFLFESLKYNFGGISPQWKEVYGNKIENDESGLNAKVTENTVLYAGNCLDCLDAYNLYYDTSVHPTKIHTEGEFFATVEMHNRFRLKKMIADKQIFNADDLPANQEYAMSYYTVRPSIRADGAATSDNSWLSILSADTVSVVKNGIEFVYMYIWLVPNDIGFGTETNMRIFRVTMANKQRIVRLQEMDNAHGMLPIGISMPWEDGFREETKSYAELLNPFQQFASFQFNTHIKANRKALYGNLFYNKTIVDLDEQFDPVASKIGVNAPADADIRKAIYQTYDAPGTENTVRDIGGLIDLMQKVLPTDILRQVAGLDRATQYQAAAVVQGSNRRNLKIAKIIDGQAFFPMKAMQMYNIMQKQEAMDILSPDGTLQQIAPKQFRDSRIEFKVSEALQGVDKLSMAMSIKEVLNSILQSQFASQQLNVVDIIDYWTSLIGDHTDFKQFKFQSEIDKLTPEQKDMAFQVFQQFMQSEEGQAMLQQSQGAQGIG